MDAAIVFICLFIVIFGIFYLHYSTRNKERLALIEKGADASIFVSNQKKSSPPLAKIFILNIALLLIGIGLGIFMASILTSLLGMNEDVAYPGTIFLCSGVGLYVGFHLTQKMKA